MPGPLLRADALRILDLPATADAAAVKRAYRRLARAHHPDAGGDPERFHELQRAYEALLDNFEVLPAVARGRPSRRRAAWTAAGGASGTDHLVDVAAIDWDLPLPDGEIRLDRQLAAVWLASDDPAPVRPLSASSRAPGSRLNRVANLLASDLTSQLRIMPAVDDRGRELIGVELRATGRRARRVLDAAPLDGGWVRSRGSSNTTLRLLVAPTAGDRRSTALRLVGVAERLLDRLGWGLSAWTLTLPKGARE